MIDDVEPLFPLQHIADKSMTPTIIRVFGCMHCEWHQSTRCPHLKDMDYFGSGDLGTKMCKHRKDFLLSLSPPLRSDMTWSDWQRGFSINLAEKTRNKCQFDLDRNYPLLIKNQESIDSCDDPVHLKTLNRVFETNLRYINSLEHRIDSLTKFIVHYQDQQVNRDTTKKVAVTQTKLKPSDVARMIKGKVKDE